MGNNNFDYILENVARALVKLSEGMTKVVEGINVIASSKAMLAFVEFLQNIPDDIKDTQFFRKVQELNKKDLHYEDVVWIVEDFGLSYTENSWEKMLEGADDKSDLYRYIAQVILSTAMEKREKLTVLLAHVEPLIYETLEVSKTPNAGLKSVVKKVSIKDNKGMSAESLGKIYVLAVTYIVFAATDYYTEEIDKRIPFRNNILHNGIVMYSDEEVDIAYELLVDLIEILMIAKEHMYAEPES